MKVFTKIASVLTVLALAASIFPVPFGGGVLAGTAAYEIAWKSDAANTLDELRKVMLPNWTEFNALIHTTNSLISNPATNDSSDKVFAMTVNGSDGGSGGTIQQSHTAASAGGRVVYEFKMYRKPVTTGGYPQTNIEFRDSSNGSTNAVILRWDRDNAIKALNKDSGVIDSKQLNPGVWYGVSIVVDYGAAETSMIAYVDGVSVTTNPVILTNEFNNQSGVLHNWFRINNGFGTEAPASTICYDDLRVYTMVPAAASSVDITSPQQKSMKMSRLTYTKDADITLKAAANAALGSYVKHVEYYCDGDYIDGSRQTAYPYAYDWSGMSAGLHSITARMEDFAGNEVFSAPLEIYVEPALYHESEIFFDNFNEGTLSSWGAEHGGANMAWETFDDAKYNRVLNMRTLDNTAGGSNWSNGMTRQGFDTTQYKAMLKLDVFLTEKAYREIYVTGLNSSNAWTGFPLGRFQGDYFHSYSSAGEQLFKTVLNCWNSLVFVIDTRAKTYDVYLNNEKIVESYALTSLDKINEGLVRIGFSAWAIGGAAIDTYFDNIGFYNLTDLPKADKLEIMHSDFPAPEETFTGDLGEVPLNMKKAVVTFNTDMTTGSFTATTAKFEKKSAAGTWTAVDASGAYNNKVYTFTLNEAIKPASDYRITFTTGITSTGGVPLPDDNVLYFSTVGNVVRSLQLKRGTVVLNSLASGGVAPNDALTAVAVIEPDDAGKPLALLAAVYKDNVLVDVYLKEVSAVTAADESINFNILPSEANLTGVSVKIMAWDTFDAMISYIPAAEY